MIISFILALIELNKKNFR